jgi:hypothetical protein
MGKKGALNTLVQARNAETGQIKVRLASEKC